MSRRTYRNSSGFTLLEVCIATSILVLAISLALGGFIYFLGESSRQFVQDELDIDVQTAMERIKRDIRLSCIEKMAFYPAGVGPYTAISLPLARDDDGDGAVDTDSNSNVIWDKTVIYHVWTGQPNQLRMTVFDPRDNALTVAQLQQQLNSVVVQGNGNSTFGASNATTTVLFENLFAWSIVPQSSTFDGYAPTMERAAETLGSVPISDGNHTFEFRVTGTNMLSKGKKIGIDTLYVSPSYSTREAESRLPATLASGATPVAQYMAGGSWSGNYHLYFPATAVGHRFTLTLENDRWEETNFRSLGELHQDTTVKFDSSLTPYDVVLMLDGCKTNWYVARQTGDTNGLSTAADRLKGCAVRVLIRGSTMISGGWVDSNGSRCQVAFKAGSGALKIEDAFIGLPASMETNTMNAISGTFRRLRFGGSESVSIASGSTRWSDMTDMPIEKSRSYLVSYVVSGDAGTGNTWRWEEMLDPGMRACYIIPASSSPGETEAQAEFWSTRGDVMATNVVYGVEAMYTTFPTNGVYTSTIFDTQLSAPTYRDMSWEEVLPTGADIRFKVRTANNANMSDASSWSNLTSFTSSPTVINPGAKRYVQYQARLIPSWPYTATPKLRRSVVRWAGETRMVDIGGIFTKGPDYGVFEVRVDGQRLTRGIVVSLQIFEYARYHGSSNRVVSALSSEVKPLNNGR